MRCLSSSLTISKLKENLPLFFRSRGSVILVIWPQVLFGILYSVAIVCIHKYSGYPFPDFPTTFIPVLGLVIGLLLVFRTTTGYDRYYEGRKLWSDMTYRIRTLARYTWLGVKDHSSPEILIEKRTAINLLVAFAYATKNYLRGEYSYDEDSDIRELTLHLPRIQDQNKKTDNGTRRRESTLSIDNPINRSESQGKLSTKSVSVDLPFEVTDIKNRKKLIKQSSRVTMSIRRRAKQNSSIETDRGSRGSLFQAHDLITPTNIPMELVYYYQTYIYSLWYNQKLNKDTATLMLNFSNELMNILAQMERILRTPIPLAYSIHLHQSIWLYMLTLPFQIVGQLGWITVPGMALACFALLGILAIGWEIENPFGYDDNDLPLDEFCEVIQHEVEKFASIKFPQPDTWIFNKDNKPFGNQSELSAMDLKDLNTNEFHWHFMNSFNIPNETVEMPEKNDEETSKENSETKM